MATVLWELGDRFTYFPPGPMGGSEGFGIVLTVGRGAEGLLMERRGRGPWKIRLFWVPDGARRVTPDVKVPRAIALALDVAALVRNIRRR